MNAKLMISSLVLLVSIGAQAAPEKGAPKSTTAPIEVSSSNLTKGVRIEFLKSFFDGKLKLSDGYSSATGSGKVEQNFSLAVGYENVNKLAPGFLGRAIFTQHNSSAESLRFDGNVTYGFNEQGYIFGGLNLNKFTKGPEKLNMGLGMQVGTGYQITSNFGITLSYVTISNSGTESGVDIDYLAQGLEFGINGTF